MTPPQATIETIEDSDRKIHAIREQLLKTRQRQQDEKATYSRSAAAQEEILSAGPGRKCYVQCGRTFVYQPTDMLVEALKLKQERSMSALPKLVEMEKSILDKLKTQEEAHQQLERDFVSQLQAAARIPKPQD